MLLYFYLQNRRSVKQCGYERIIKENKLVKLEEEREFLRRMFEILKNRIDRYEKAMNLSLVASEEKISKERCFRCY